jgi:hypothetical protein
MDPAGDVTRVPACIWETKPRRVWLLSAYALAWFLFAYGFAEEPQIGLLGLAVLLALGRFVRRRAVRTEALVIRPGALLLPGGRKVRVRQVRGATTATTPAGCLLTLDVGTADLVHIEVGDADGLALVVKALGIGHAGFGEVALYAEPHPYATRIVFAAVALAAAGFAVSGNLGTRDAEGFSWGVLTLLTMAAFLSQLARFSLVTRLVLEGSGLHVRRIDAPGWDRATFADVRDVKLDEAGLTVVLDRGVLRLPVRTTTIAGPGLSRAELELVAAQIRGAALRARGFGTPRTEASDRLAALGRKGRTETARAWLARVDAETAGGSDYRTTSFAHDDLWLALEDPDADADVRAAAARLLTRSLGEAARVRVAAAVAAERDERTASRIRVAVDIESDELDASEAAGERDLPRTCRAEREHA